MSAEPSWLELCRVQPRFNKVKGITPEDRFFFSPRIGRISPVVTSVIRQKQQKPLAVDARCLLRAIDAVAARKSLKQAWIFSASHTITHPGSCIHRKAINKDKPLSSGVLPSRQQYHIGDYPGTPPPSVYQVTHGTALQAAECYV